MDSNRKRTLIRLSVSTIAAFLIMATAIWYSNSSLLPPSHLEGNTSGQHLGSSGLRFTGEKTRTYSPDTKNSGPPPPVQVPPFDRIFDGKVKNCPQWAVVTTIHAPDESIIGVSNLRKWCLVIVGDNITPDDAYDDLARKDNVFYLSVSDQKEHLPGATSRFIEMMPFDSFARKNIGFLFAVQYGARVVFDFDDDNVLAPLEDGVTVPPPFLYREEVGFNKTVLLEFVESGNSSALAFNPYEFMRASHKYSWPRGFPIDFLQKNFETWGETSTTVGDMKYSSIGVIQSLCNGDPDNDAVFRMTRPDSTSFTFGRTATSLPLLIPYSAYTPYNAQATTHLYKAFWGLYLPITAPGRVTDIWRSYLAQRIMKDIGLQVMYTPPIVKHERSAHDYLADFEAESDLYGKTTELLIFLDSWSSVANTLPERITDLWIALYERDYIHLNDVEAVKEWLRTLLAVGYKYPSIRNDGSVISQNHANPLLQPTLEGQPYRSLPFFNAKEGERPESAILKVILITMNEWPLLKSWVFYHGEVLGFENLYILDSSTDARCISFLRYARDIIGTNVVFSAANLNEVEGVINKIAKDISGSSDLIMKMDTDELLVVHENITSSLTTAIPAFLSGFGSDEKHPLHLVKGDSRVGWYQTSLPQEDVCMQNTYATPDKFPLNDVLFIGEGSFDYFKGVYDARLPFTKKRFIDSGGHASRIPKGNWTELGVIHCHYRCLEIEVHNSKQALERHKYIDPSATDTNKVLEGLMDRLKCPSTSDDFCDTCNLTSTLATFASYHKAVWYARWLSCPERIKEEYYGPSGQGTFNDDVIKTMERSRTNFDL